MKFGLMVVLWSLLLLVIIPSCGKKVDKICIKGKARLHQKVATWGYPGEIIMEPGDRVLARECSEFMRKVTLRNQYDAIRDYVGPPLRDWL